MSFCSQNVREYVSGGGPLFLGACPARVILSFSHVPTNCVTTNSSTCPKVGSKIKFHYKKFTGTKQILKSCRTRRRHKEDNGNQNMYSNQSISGQSDTPEELQARYRCDVVFVLSRPLGLNHGGR